MSFTHLETPHRRYNPLTGEFVLVSPHRTKRPWQGRQDPPSTEQKPSYDPTCYLCPGNQRAEGQSNPAYDGTYVFTNDFAALLPTPLEVLPSSSHDLLQIQPIQGTCRVICFSPRHDLTLPEMPIETIVQVVNLWAEQTEALGQMYQWVQVFENKGAVMGSSNPHPHGQIWAHSTLPNEITKEDAHQGNYYLQKGSVLLMDYLQQELQQDERVVVANDDWVAVVPFWAIWPYEVLLLPRRHVVRITQLTPSERLALADILKRLLTRYDNLFETSFPYSMGWHGAPFNANDPTPWQLHAHFYPPLLRSASVKKFMVGYEMLGEAQRDITAEQAALRLRALSEVHYKTR